jgi:hypothetical protein
MKRFLATVLGLSLLVLVLAACGKGQGYGVVLWAPQASSLATGEVVSVARKAREEGELAVRSRQLKGLFELEAWRLALYPARSQAEAEGERYQRYKDLFAYALRDGLPLREQPNQEARRVYKLRQGELVKVLERGEAKVLIATYEDYWYRVLTEDGSEGWCFGYFLPVFPSAGDPQAEAVRLMAQDPLLDAMVSTSWRPEYFQEMADSGRIDLERFRPEIGLFFDTAKKQVQLALPDFHQSWDYREISSVGPNRYVIAGPELRVTMSSRDRLVLTYFRKEQQLSQVFINFTGDLEQAIKAEGERRQARFREFLDRGPLMSSSGYGRIRLMPGSHFSWDGFGRLGDQVFMRQVQGGGTVDFPYYLSADLGARYDGVVTFRFNEYKADEGTSFLYKFDEAGVRFEYLALRYIQGDEAVGVSPSPLVIYFSFGKS